jgi:cytochrome c oxidase subunit 2
VKERSILLIILISLVLIGIGYFVATSADLSFILPEEASQQAVLIDQLFRLLMGIAVVVFLLVEGALLYTIIRFRRKSGEVGEGKPSHGNSTLEAVWTVIPAIIVAVIGVYSYQVLVQIEEPQPDPLVVQVVGRQYVWEFIYPEDGISSNTLHLPVDRPVVFQIESKDVIHSFWVPEFRIKRDATPGQIDELFITPIQIGRFPIRCAELCGAGHAAMVSEVVVESEEDFRAWLDAGGVVPIGPAGEETDGQAEVGAPDGRAVFIRYGCGACHLAADAGGAGVVGPPLDGISAIAGDRVEGLSAREYLRQSIIATDDFIVDGYPSNVMPNDFGDRMTEDEIDVLVEYLLQQ